MSARTHVCPDCPQAFHSPGGLKSHRAQVHGTVFHGRQRYKTGCRCQECRDAVAAYGRERYAVRGRSGRPKPGTSRATRSVELAAAIPAPGDDWSTQAACAERPDLPWDTNAAGTMASKQTRPIRAALNVCAACPVRTDCLTDARRTETYAYDVHGIRGGLTAPERKATLPNGATGRTGTNAQTREVA